MKLLATRWRGVCAALGTMVILCSCSSTSNAPQPGTPAFYWSAAKETWGLGDYAKAIDNLDKLSSDSEYAGRAQPWLLIVTSGLSQGYTDLAESYESGARINKAEPLTFRRQANNYRNAASRLALHFAEVYQDFQKGKEDSVTLALPYPSGSPNPVVTLARVGNGILPPANEMEMAQKRSLERAVLLEACRAAGAPDDPAKTQELLKSGDAKVPRAVFVTAMARALYEASQMYTSRKLDDPEKLKIFCSRAQEALKTVPESKETKDLNSKIAAALKQAKAG
ncbi:MAG TPA: hypothetical protein VFA33_19045 [Bryobacteraceae bacterium]|nr:hypothetical protein [Bryobacteraceae bacterium]